MSNFTLRVVVLRSDYVLIIHDLSSQPLQSKPSAAQQISRHFQTRKVELRRCHPRVPLAPPVDARIPLAPPPHPRLPLDPPVHPQLSLDPPRLSFYQKFSSLSRTAETRWCIHQRWRQRLSQPKIAREKNVTRNNGIWNFT